MDSCEYDAGRVGAACGARRHRTRCRLHVVEEAAASCGVSSPEDHDACCVLAGRSSSTRRSRQPYFNAIAIGGARSLLACRQTLDCLLQSSLPLLARPSNKCIAEQAYVQSTAAPPSINTQYASCVYHSSGAALPTGSLPPAALPYVRTLGLACPCRTKRGWRWGPGRLPRPFCRRLMTGRDCLWKRCCLHPGLSLMAQPM